MIVLWSLVAALAGAVGAVLIRQHVTAADPSQGMQAFGDLLFGVLVFSVLGLLPLGLALHWLRPVPRFWAVLGPGTIIYAATGPLALLTGSRLAAAGPWALLNAARIGTMPLSALLLATCLVFAPTTRLRWLFATTAFLEGATFSGIVIVKIILPATR